MPTIDQLKDKDKFNGSDERGLSRTARGGVSQGAIWPNAVDLQYGMHGLGGHNGPSVILG